jgi:hypothetical protein
MKFSILKQDCAQKLRLKLDSFQQNDETVEEENGRKRHSFILDLTLASVR